jgi:hypothetical protein
MKERRRSRSLRIFPSPSFLAVLVCGVVVLPPAGHGSSVSVDFNHGTELATLFTVNDFSSVGWTARLTQVPDGGIANSGAVDVDAVNSPAAATYHGSSFAFRPGAPLSASIFFKFQAFTLPPQNSRNLVELGFVDGPDGTFSLNNDDMSVRVSSSETGENNLFAGFGRHGVGLAGDLRLVDGHWYRVAGTFENLGTTLSIAASLEDYGPTGEGPGTPLRSIHFTADPDGNILTDTEVWLGFEANSLGGADLLDNLAGAGPRAEFAEPASGTVMVLALLSLLGWAAAGGRGRLSQPLTAPAVMPFTNHSERNR